MAYDASWSWPTRWWRSSAPATSTAKPWPPSSYRRSVRNAVFRPSIQKRWRQSRNPGETDPTWLLHTLYGDFSEVLTQGVNTMANAAAVGADGKPLVGTTTGDTGQTMQETMRSWMMIVLTLVFVAIYVGALLGLIPGSNKTDAPTLSRIESIVFVIIGYYFGRLPAQATEQTLKGEINRQAQKADVAEQVKTTALQEKQGLQEKVKNAKAALASAVPVPVAPAPEAFTVHLRKALPESSPDALRQSVLAAVNVLDS
jgi:hypothetical protein